jgi:hypothetical protein
MLKREAAYRELVKLIGASETAGPNRGPVVDAIEEADNLPGIGYSYCQSTQNYTWRLANGEYLAGGTASVWAFASWARTRGYIVTVPGPYDHVTYDFGEGSGGPYDHVGQIEKVLSADGMTVTLQTIEGNTSPSVAGSQSNGGGIYRKVRTVQRSRVLFVRVPGACPNSKRYDPKPPPPPVSKARLLVLRAWIGARHKAGWSWTRIKGTANWREYVRGGGK